MSTLRWHAGISVTVRVLSCRVCTYVRTKCHTVLRHRLKKGRNQSEPCSLRYGSVTRRSRKEPKNKKSKNKIIKKSTGWAQRSICEQRWTRMTATTAAPAPVPGSSHHLNHQPYLRRSAIRQAMTEPMRISSFSSTVLVRTLSHLPYRCFFLMHKRYIPVPS